MEKNKKKDNRSSKKGKAKQVRRVRLVDGFSVLWTSLILAASGGGMLAMQLLGWFDTVIGSVLSVLIAAFFCAMVFDLGLLLTSCVTIADGMINAGKDAQGNQLIFHTANIEEIYLTDKNGQPIPENQKRYRGASLTFVMASGRINRRAPRNYTQKQLDSIRQAVK